MLFTQPGKLLPHFLNFFFFFNANITIAKKYFVIQVETGFRLHWKSARANVSEGKEDSVDSLLSLCSCRFHLSSGLQRIPEHCSPAPVIPPNILNNKADVASHFHRPLGNIFLLLMSTFSSYIHLSLLPQGGFYSHCVSHYGSEMPNQATTLQWIIPISPMLRLRNSDCYHRQQLQNWWI